MMRASYFLGFSILLTAFLARLLISFWTLSLLLQADLQLKFLPFDSSPFLTALSASLRERRFESLSIVFSAFEHDLDDLDGLVDDLASFLREGAFFIDLLW